VPITHPGKVVFDEIGVTKLDLMHYYTAVVDGALRGVRDGPMILKRFVKGIGHEAVFQKRAPEKRPDFVDVAELKYASGTSATEAVVRDVAGLIWAENLGCVDLNPHPVRADDLDPPDELRVDLQLFASLFFGFRGRQDIGDGNGEVVVGHLGQIDVLESGHGADHGELAGELLDLIDADVETQPVTERFGILGVGAGHHDDRLSGGEPQVGCAHHDQRRAGVAFVVEGIQVRMSTAALVR